MTDGMFFVSPGGLIGGSIVHPQMVKDLLGVAAIPTDSIKQLVAALEAENGFLDEERLGEIAAEYINDAAQASAAANAIQNLRAGVLDQVLAMINAWRESNATNVERFPDAAFDSLGENLPSLVQEYPALSRMRKSDRLRGVLGNELEGVHFICDARPVFDQDRQRIEGLLALTTMKLVYERQNGVTEEVEIAINREELVELISKAQKAQQKLRVLEESIAEWIDDVAE